MSTTLSHDGLPAGVGRLDLLSLIEDLGKRGLGIFSSAARLLRHYVWRSRDSDYLAGRICAVWDRVSGTAEQLDLCSRAVNEAERELERKGLIARTTGGNGARSVSGAVASSAGRPASTSARSSTGTPNSGASAKRAASSSRPSPHARPRSGTCDA
jgi:hypothetical protein